MNAVARNTSLDFDPDTRARDDNAHKLAQIDAASAQGREMTFAGAQKHMRFSWKQAAAPVSQLVESLYDYFHSAAEVTVVGGGAHPFDRESQHLTVDIGFVSEVISHEGVGSGLALLGKHLEDPSFQEICNVHHVSEVFTPANDLEVRARKVQHHNQPRPL